MPASDRYGSAPADLVRCGVCGHVQVGEFPPDAALGEAYGGASDEAYVEEEAGQRATARIALERIERRAPARGALLDVGCWVGFLLDEAEERGWEAWGVEPSEWAAGLARERVGPGRVQTGTLETSDLPRKAFDAVHMGDVIEHLPDPASALERVRQLLSRDGVLYLALPDAGSRVARALGARWWSVLPTHLQYFSRASMRVLLERSGYVPLWMGTAPKSFSARYYAERLGGYSRAAAGAAVRAAVVAGLADRMVAPDFHDRMAVLARVGER